MAKVGADDWRTPLGYYERAITDMARTREEFQVELQQLKECRVTNSNIHELSSASFNNQTLSATISDPDDVKQNLSETTTKLQQVSQQIEQFQFQLSQLLEQANYQQLPER